MTKFLSFYLQLIKAPQTGLLVLTAVAGYRSSSSDNPIAIVIFALLGLLLVVSGTTALNMVFDHDIDTIMSRTKKRPLPLGKLSDFDASMFGIFLIAVGMAINFFISTIFAVVVFAGLFFDLVIYTFWLKRKSPWSIVFGGLAGGMPILAGRILSTGIIDLNGLLLMTAILLWIPTHILTLAMNHSEDYKLAGVPTFPNVFGFRSARYFIALTNITAGFIIMFVFINLEIGISGIMIHLVSTLVLIMFSIRLIKNPSKESNFSLFRYASIYMGIAMLILII